MELDKQEKLEKEKKLKAKKIALLIDGDNISYKYIPYIISQCNNLGKIKIKRYYGMSIRFNNQELLNTLTAYKIKIRKNNINDLSGKTYKNSTDYILINEVGDILKKDKIDIFCIATGDSDFIGMVKNIKSYGKLVYIFGDDNSSLKLQESCDRFEFLKNLDASEKTVEKSENLSEELEKIKEENKNFTEIKDKLDEFNQKLLEFERYFKMIADNLVILKGKQQEILDKSIISPRILQEVNTNNDVNIEKELRQLVLLSVKTHSKKDGWSHLNEVLAEIKFQKPNFYVKQYARKFSEFLALFPELEVDNNQVRLRNL